MRLVTAIFISLKVSFICIFGIHIRTTRNFNMIPRRYITSNTSPSFYEPWIIAKSCYNMSMEWHLRFCQRMLLFTASSSRFISISSR